MRVLITGPSLSVPGGVAAYCRSVHACLGAGATYVPVGARGGGEGFARGLPRLIRDYANFTRMVALGGFDVVHLNPSFASKALVREALFLLISKLFRKPVVVYLHGWVSECERAVRARYLRPFRAFAGLADAIVVLAESFRRTLEELGIRKPVFVEATVCDVCSFCPDEASTTPSADGCTLLFLSRIDKGKGAYETLDAYLILKHRYPGLKLVIAGDGPELAGLRHYAGARGAADVQFLGHVSGQAKHEAFARAGVYVMPSHGEGMPISVLEAMAHGLPVVTCAVGGIADFFVHGTMGFLAEKPDPACVVAALEPLVADASLRAQIGRNNRACAAEWFTPRVAAGRLNEIYRSVVSRKAAVRGSSWLERANRPAVQERV